ncbi:MAG TPA: CBS domain-containing protein [Bryobacteraceae bacterium]|nr:CBS domain-containing protein [Bryobacteraceae bacterium]
MQVRDVMARKTVSCKPETNLAEAAVLMWKHQCGFLPVTGEGGNVIGVITDRDISIALGTRNQRPSEVRVWDVMPKQLFTCTAGDDLHNALMTLRSAKIRRLPVIDPEGALIGVLSIDDIVLQARGHVLGQDVSYKDVEDTYKAIQRRARSRKKGDCAAA